jgi:uncharacterized protein YbjT (DUF2867 family)
MILVVGATGTLGGRITRGLLRQEKEVRILVRDPSPSVELAPMGLATSADTLVTAGAQLVTGDLTDRASLTAACAGVDTVITTATAAKRDGDLEAVDLNGTLNLIDAAVEAGVSHFIYTSAYGSVIGSPNPMLHIRATCEKALVESGLTWTILQVTYLYEVLGSMVIGIPLQAGEPVSLFEDGRHRHSFIKISAGDSPLQRGEECAFPSLCYNMYVCDHNPDGKTLLVIGRDLPEIRLQQTP